MGFLNLPSELLMLIGEQLKTEKDVYALLRTNSRFYRPLLPQLYKHNVDYSSSSALSWCVSHGNEGGVGLLLKWVANVQFCKAPLPNIWGFDEDFGHALHFATSRTMAQLLLEHGADVNDLSHQGKTSFALGCGKWSTSYGGIISRLWCTGQIRN
jgi:hypothetical protein